jgi:hypothetical protein
MLGALNDDVYLVNLTKLQNECLVLYAFVDVSIGLVYCALNQGWTGSCMISPVSKFLACSILKYEASLRIMSNFYFYLSGLPVSMLEDQDIYPGFSFVVCYG